MFHTLIAFWVVLSGYCFVSTWHWTRYILKRLPNQQLYFRSAFWGGVLFLLSLAIAPALISSEQFYRLASFTLKPLGLSQSLEPSPTLITQAFITSLLGLFGGFALNWLSAFRAIILNPRSVGGDFKAKFDCSFKGIIAFILKLPTRLYSYSVERPMNRAIEYLNLDLERMLVKSIENQQLVMLSLASNQVYIGRVTGAIDPADDDDMLRILPVISGWRDERTKKFEPENFYDELYDKIESAEDPKPSIDICEIALRISEISSVRLFDVDIYLELNP